MYTQWLQPIPEKKYIRCVYVGKVRLLPAGGKSSKAMTPTLEQMIQDIWQNASVFNRQNFISGHLSCSTTLHVVQCLEGKEQVVLALLDRIKKDPRVVIHKVFLKTQQAMHMGWSLSMCYSFEISPAQLELVQKTELTLEEMFDMMKNTYEACEENLNVQEFYKEIMETILLKFIAVTDGESSASKELQP